MPRGAIQISLPPPLGGVVKNKPKHYIGKDFLSDAKNVYSKYGSLVVRSGYKKFVASNVNSRVMGGKFYKLNDLSEKTVLGSISGWYSYNTTSSVWDQRFSSAQALTGGNEDQLRFAVFQTGGSTLLLGVNDMDNPKKWDGSTSFYSDIGGSPPKARDLCVAANRVILGNISSGATRFPSRIRISNFNDAETWVASLVVDLTDTLGEIVGMEALNRTSFAIHKADSQWIGVAQAGSFPFRFEMMDTQSGAVSPASIIRIGGMHYYMAQDASFYVFDGIKSKEIGEKIIPNIVDNINWEKLKIIYGEYYSLLKQIWWFYPSEGSTTCDLSVSYNIKTQEWQFHQFAHNITAAVSFNLQEDSTEKWSDISGTIGSWEGSWDEAVTGKPALLLGADDGTVFEWGHSPNDDGVKIDAYFTFPLFASQNLDKDIRIDAVDSFWNKTDEDVTVSINFGITDSLATDNIFIVTETFNIKNDERHLATVSNVEGRFGAIKHSVESSVGNLEFLGAILFMDEKSVI
jgi:hypothetical protein